jgi:hypothetical protein
VGVAEHAQHAEGLVVLDEPHASHVGRELVDIARIATDGAADPKVAYIAISRPGEILSRWKHLMPVFERLDIDRPHVACPKFKQPLDEVTADESTATGDDNDFLCHAQSCLIPGIG